MAHCDRTILFLTGSPAKNLLSDYRNAGAASAAGAERERSPRERLSGDFYRANYYPPWWLELSNYLFLISVILKKGIDTLVKKNREIPFFRALALAQESGFFRYFRHSVPVQRGYPRAVP